MARELQKMRSQESGFPSVTGATFYFDGNQDSPGIYELVNLNVCTLKFINLDELFSSLICVTREFTLAAGKA